MFKSFFSFPSRFICKIKRLYDKIFAIVNAAFLSFLCDDHLRICAHLSAYQTDRNLAFECKMNRTTSHLRERPDVRQWALILIIYRAGTAFSL
jgi:hypothetical protein